MTVVDKFNYMQAQQRPRQEDPEKECKCMMCFQKVKAKEGTFCHRVGKTVDLQTKSGRVLPMPSTCHMIIGHMSEEQHTKFRSGNHGDFTDGFMCNGCAKKRTCNSCKKTECKGCERHVLSSIFAPGQAQTLVRCDKCNHKTCLNCITGCRFCDKRICPGCATTEIRMCKIELFGASKIVKICEDCYHPPEHSCDQDLSGNHGNNPDDLSEPASNDSYENWCQNADRAYNGFDDAFGFDSDIFSDTEDEKTKDDDDVSMAASENEI